MPLFIVTIQTPGFDLPVVLAQADVQVGPKFGVSGYKVVEIVVC